MNRVKKGDTFTEAVAAIQRLMGPDAKVCTKEYLTDRLGHSREYDVVVRGKFAGHDILAVIECKNWKKRVGPDAIEAFATKTKDLRSDINLFASRKGFTKKALEKAIYHNIEPLSLLPQDDDSLGFDVGTVWFAEFFKWLTITFGLDFVEKKAPDGLSPHEIKLNGKKIINWFFKELDTTYKKEKINGWHSIRVIFSKPIELTIGPNVYLVQCITCYALRSYTKKSRFMGWRGNGFIEWKHNRVKIPQGTEIFSDEFSTDFSGWDSYEGEIPSSKDQNVSFAIRIASHQEPLIDPQEDVIDLKKLSIKIEKGIKVPSHKKKNNNH